MRSELYRQRRSDRALQETPTASPVPPKDHPEDHAEKPKKKPVKSHESTSGSSTSSASGESSSGSESSSVGSHTVTYHSSPSHHSSSSSNHGSSNHDNSQGEDAAHGTSKKPLLLLIGVAASSLLIAGYTKSRRRVAVVNDHPLKGSVGRRMKLFGELAGRAGRTVDRSVSEDDMNCYKSADDIGIAIV